MRKIPSFILLLLLTLFSHMLLSQTTEEYTMKINDERKLKNEQMSNVQTTPLTQSDLADFDSLDYYPVDAKYRIEGTMNANDVPQNVSLNTTKGTRQELSKYGKVNFTFDGKQYSLTVYRNNNLPEFGDAAQQLFIPFSDLTSGQETNADGRYLPVDIAQGQTKVTLDFNKAINPFSAYNANYASVLPPPENQLVFGIVSGERKYEHREK